MRNKHCFCSTIGFSDRHLYAWLLGRDMIDSWLYLTVVYLTSTTNVLDTCKEEASFIPTSTSSLLVEWLLSSISSDDLTCRWLILQLYSEWPGINTAITARLGLQIDILCVPLLGRDMIDCFNCSIFYLYYKRPWYL